MGKVGIPIVHFATVFQRLGIVQQPFRFSPSQLSLVTDPPTPISMQNIQTSAAMAAPSIGSLWALRNQVPVWHTVTTYARDMFIHNICCHPAGAWFEDQNQYAAITLEVLHEVYSTVVVEGSGRSRSD